MTTDKLRPMTKKDVPGVYKFINEQLEYNPNNAENTQ